MPDNIGMTETTQMAMIGELRKVLIRLHYPLEVMRNTKQPPAKAGGFELRTESPDTRRLNDAS